jgi:hypothetical protein
MNHRTLLCAAAVLAALTAIGSYTAKPLWAQVKAALVQNIDEPGRNPFHADRSFTSNEPSPGLSCVNNICRNFYGVVPSGKRLVITNVTGEVYVDAPGTIVNVTLYDSNTVSPLATTLIPSTPQSGVIFGSNSIGVSASVLAYFDAGTQPTVQVYTTSPISQAGFIGASEISIAGYYVSVP